MMHFNAWGGSMAGLHLQMLLCSLLFLAAVFSVVWAIRFAKKEELRNWIIGLVVVGLIGGLIMGLLGGYGRWTQRGEYGDFPFMMRGGMLDCAQDEECHQQMEEFMNGRMRLGEGN